MGAVVEWVNKITLKNLRKNVLMDEFKNNYPASSIILEDYFSKAIEQDKIFLPDLSFENDTIFILSDYGGESSNSKYLTFSFLLCSYKQLAPFYEEMSKIREKNGLNEPSKEISFKDFHYGPISRSLDDYLKAINILVPGLIFTLVVNKNVQTVFGNDKKSAQKFLTKTLKEYGFGDWKPNVAEKLILILHSMSYLIGLLSKDNQKLFWMTDNDAIAPNKEKFNITLDLFSRILNLYTKNKFEPFGGATPFEEKDYKFLDLLSIPDIVAGSIEHYLTRDKKMEDLTVSEGANKVLMWLALDGISLKKQSIIINRISGGLQYGILKFNLKEPPEDIQYVPIFKK